MLNRFKNALYGASATDDSSIRSQAEYQRSTGESLIHRTLTRSSSFREDLLSGVDKARGNGNNNHKNKQSNGLDPIRGKNQVLTISSLTSRESFISNHKSSEINNRQLDFNSNSKVAKYRYSRPEFLQLKTDDEISVSADHQIRPIILPRDVSRLPWKAGYAECINAGKSARNEDQAMIYKDHIVRQSSYLLHDKEDSISIQDKVPWVYFGMFDGHAGTAVAVAAASQLHNIIRDKLQQIGDLLMSLEFGNYDDDVEYTNTYSQVTTAQTSSAAPSFDNPPPSDVSSTLPVASELTNKEHEDPDLPDAPTDIQLFSELITVLEENEDVNEDSSRKTNDIAQVNNVNIPTDEQDPKNNGSVNLEQKLINRLTFGLRDEWPSLIDMLRNNVTVDSLITGVLESAFWEMDSLIAQDKQDYKMPGGCTALVSLFILGRLYVCNAGDSRAIVYKNRKVVPMSNDFTPISERERILRLGLQRQELLGSDFTHLEFLKRPTRKDLGKQILYKDAYMTGWSIKTATYDDLRFPLVWGEGKRSRVLATIGVTRGFGDHELRSQYGSVPIKPFLTPEPEVRVLRLDDDDSLQPEDVLIMGTDGLWDVTRNEEAASIVEISFDLFPYNEESRSKYRYITAAQDLVIHSRGHTNNWNNIWRTNCDRLASFDDISVFVIPLRPYRDEYNEWLKERSRLARNKINIVNRKKSNQI